MESKDPDPWTQKYADPCGSGSETLLFCLTICRIRRVALFSLVMLDKRGKGRGGEGWHGGMFLVAKEEKIGGEKKR